MTIGLVIIAKDEASTLPLCVDSASEIVDTVTVLDTGSSDDTVDVAEHLGATVHHADWQGFGPARTLALELARQSGSDYLLMLDADHRLHIDGHLPELTLDSYRIRVRGPVEWKLPLLTRATHPFVYRGVAHAYLHSDFPTSEGDVPLSIDGGPGASVEKLQGDLLLLQRAFAENPSDSRTVFYLAQTYADLDMYDEAIVFYRLRAGMPGFVEETYWARHQLGVLLGERVSFADGARELLNAWDSRRTRAESLRALANLANSVADKLEQPDDVLFVRPSAYRQVV